MIEEIHLKIAQLSNEIDFIKVLIPEMLLNILEKMGIKLNVSIYTSTEAAKDSAKSRNFSISMIKSRSAN